MPRTARGLHYEVTDLRAPWLQEKRAGRPVVFHHGVGASLDIFVEWMPIVATRHPVVRFDMRGDHSKGEYVRQEDGRPIIHTNTVENYFRVFKRRMRGTYQRCKEKHLHRYLAKFGFRFNARSALGVEDEARTEKALRGIKGKRLTYRSSGRPGITA